MFRYLLLFMLFLSLCLNASNKGLKLIYTNGGQEVTRY
jgi:hypothetical protein